MMPRMFVEIGEDLAAESGIASGSEVTKRCARGEIRSIAVVTKRLQLFHNNGGRVHQIALP